MLDVTNKTVVFTGPAKFNGEAVLRDDLTDAAVNAGCTVRAKVDWRTDLLVASRTDTKKAKAAAEMGVRVIDYQVFGVLLHQAGCTPTHSGRKPDPYVDTVHEGTPHNETPVKYGSLL